MKMLDKIKLYLSIAGAVLLTVLTGGLYLYIKGKRDQAEHSKAMSEAAEKTLKAQAEKAAHDDYKELSEIAGGDHADGDADLLDWLSKDTPANRGGNI
jgi:hypothetical protein